MRHVELSTVVIALVVFLTSATIAFAEIEINVSYEDYYGNCIHRVTMHNTSNGGWRIIEKPCGSNDPCFHDTGWYFPQVIPTGIFVSPTYDGNGNILVASLPGYGGIIHDAGTPTCRPFTADHSSTLVIPASMTR